MKIIRLIFVTFLVYSFFYGSYISAYTNNYPYGEEPEPKNSTDCVPDNWGFCKWNCTSYAAWRVRENYISDFQNGYTKDHIYQQYGNAEHWNDAASAQGFTTSLTPSVGSFAVWEATGCNPGDSYGYQGSCNPAGHIAYVEAVNSDGSITISQYNLFYSGAYSEATLSGSNLPSSYIRFGSFPNSANSCSGQANMVISTTKNNINCGVSNLIYLSPYAKITGESKLYIN